MNHFFFFLSSHFIFAFFHFFSPSLLRTSSLLINTILLAKKVAFFFNLLPPGFASSKDKTSTVFSFSSSLSFFLPLPYTPPQTRDGGEFLTQEFLPASLPFLFVVCSFFCLPSSFSVPPSFVPLLDQEKSKRCSVCRVFAFVQRIKPKREKKTIDAVENRRIVSKKKTRKEIMPIPERDRNKKGKKVERLRYPDKR